MDASNFLGLPIVSILMLVEISLIYGSSLSKSLMLCKRIPSILAQLSSISKNTMPFSFFLSFSLSFHIIDNKNFNAQLVVVL